MRRSGYTANGDYELSLAPGTYIVKVSKHGYETSSEFTIILEEGTTFVQNFVLELDKDISVDKDNSVNLIEHTIQEKVSLGKISVGLSVYVDEKTISYYSDYPKIDIFESTENTVSLPPAYALAEINSLSDTNLVPP